MSCQPTVTGYKCEKGKELTISSPLDASNPLTSHVWTVDGIEESTSSSFKKTYPGIGTHTVKHAGKNTCLSGCTETIDLEIVEPPKPPAQSSIVPLAIGVVMVFGFLGIVMLKKQ